MTGKKTGKRLLTWVLTLMMVLTLLPLNVLAAEVGQEEPLQMSDEDDSRNDTDEDDSLGNDNEPNNDNIQFAEFYYLMSPTSDPDSNRTNDWGDYSLGDGTIDINGLLFDNVAVNAKNAFNIQPENIKQWPDNSTAGLSFTLDKNNKDQFVNNWNEIFKNYKKSIQAKYGDKITITEDDITSITFTPHKISDNFHVSLPHKYKYHVDCTVEINCGKFVTAKFFFVDSEGNKVQLASNYYKNGESISPKDIDKAETAANDKVPNGCKLIKWYSDPACTILADPSAPLKGNVNFYCTVQVVTYTVNYLWNGTPIKDFTTGTAAYGETVTVTAPSIDGYTPVKESETLTIDDNKVINLNYYKNVELTANSDTRVYNGVEQTLEGYTCDTEGVTFEGITASGKGTDVDEYPVTFKGNPVGKLATVDNKDYIITKANEGTLEITPVTEEVTVTIKGNTKTVYYNGKEQSVEGYTVSISNPLYTESDFSLRSGITAEAKGKKVGTYDMGLTNESFENTSENFTNVVFVVEDGYLKIKRHAVAPSRPTEPEVEEEPFKLNTDDHFAYIIGYPDGTVQPNGQITRAEATTIFFRLLTDESREANLTKTNRYTDVAAGAWYNTAISTMTRAGIVDGYPDGTFRPDAPITRAEMSKIISLFAELDKKTDRFSDIAGHWAEKYIKLAAGNGWIEGYPDGTFLPQRNITRAETATMINRVLERVPSQESRLLDRAAMQTWPDANPGDWFYLAIQEATNSHDYERSEKWDAADEQWTALRETRDWKALEQ